MVLPLLSMPHALTLTEVFFTNTLKEASVNTENIWINDCSAGGINIYVVMQGHSVYDEILSDKPLTMKQQHDIIDGYREALDHYTKETV